MNDKPLAYRMCPESLDEFVGQQHIIGKDKFLYRAIKADRIPSMIFFGPSGTGKTTLARIIASTTKRKFERLNAVSAGVSDIKKIVEDAKNHFINPSGSVILFIDEIHRFNKAQQDALLPSVEDGTVILIGATTENPFFEVNRALISRTTVLMFKPLTTENIIQLLKNALTDKQKGLGNSRIEMDDSIIEVVASLSNGDARVALNALELMVMTSNLKSDGTIHIDLNTAQECMQKKVVSYDKSSEHHYDNISAFIKSMRGSDADAAVFYLARMLYAGEDPMFIARRIMICAAEDVGMANPNALQVAVAAAEAVRMVGMPEARIILAQAAIAVAVSPKSNAAYMAINNALDDVENKPTGEVPMHLRNAEISGMDKLGYGKGYKYAHDYEGNYVKQQYLPDNMKGIIYYNPTNNGYEARIKEWIDRTRNDISKQE